MATPPLDELMIADYVKSLHKLTGIPSANYNNMALETVYSMRLSIPMR